MVLVALFVALTVVGIGPGPGAVLVSLGWIAGYIGGKLIPR